MSGELRRTCGACGGGELRLIGGQALRGGGREDEWSCSNCGTTVKLLSPLGRIVFGALAIASTAMVPYLAVTDRIARESERPWILLLIGGLAAVMVGLFVVDGRRQRRNPVKRD